MNLMKILESVFENSKRRYGAPRMTKALNNLGHRVTRSTVSRWMKEANLIAKTKRKFRVVTTDSSHKMPIAENVLNRNFNPEKPGAPLASDITYIPTHEGWLYLAITLDLFSRRVVGWSMNATMTEELVTSALTMALGRSKLAVGAIHHSDRGSQYAAKGFQTILAYNKITTSMSRKGNCWDNSPTESFFHSLKTELVYFENYQTREEAKKSIFEYIEVFYNRERLHSTINYKSPVDFETEYAQCA